MKITYIINSVQIFNTKYVNSFLSFVQCSLNAFLIICLSQYCCHIFSKNVPQKKKTVLFPLLYSKVLNEIKIKSNLNQGKIKRKNMI